MKKYFNKLFRLFSIIVCVFFSYQVSAVTLSNNLRITNYTYNNLPVPFPAAFHVKKTTDKSYVYSFNYAKKQPVAGITYTKGNEITDKGIQHIMSSAFSAKTDDQFFIYQNALWLYLIDTGNMEGPFYDLTKFNATIRNSNVIAAQTIRQLVNNAKNSHGIDIGLPVISIDTKNAKFTYDEANDSYVLSPIRIVSSVSDFNVSLTEAPAGAVVKINGMNASVVIPKKGTNDLTFKVKLSVTGKKNVVTSYYYSPSDANYQSVIVPVQETKSTTVVKTLSLVHKKTIDVINVNEKNEGLVGSTLEIVNNKGVVVESWTSDGRKHTVKNLNPGTYTLQEKNVPSGYAFSNQKIVFTIHADGTIVDENNKEISIIKFENSKTKVNVSLKDASTKKEVDGAIIAILNQDGKEIISWTSTDKVHVISGLNSGTYKVVEKSAPDGYKLFDGEIIFKLDQEGNLYNKEGKKVTNIVLYNEKEVKHFCEEYNGKYYGSDGNIVSSDYYKKQCLTGENTILISNKDRSSGNEIFGSTLIVKDSNNKVIDTWVSNGNVHEIKKLDVGTYYLMETIAPNDYILNDKYIKFEVKKTTGTIRLTLYNTKKEQTVVENNRVDNENDNVANANVADTASAGSRIVVENTVSYKNVFSIVIGSIILGIGIFLVIFSSKVDEVR